MSERQEFNKLTDKILRSEAPGMRDATLVDAHHFRDGENIISFIIYDKAPYRLGNNLQHERRWVVVVSLHDATDTQSWSKTGGIARLYWEDVDGQ